MDYLEKYLKYKEKYLTLKNIYGSGTKGKTNKAKPEPVTVTVSSEDNELMTFIKKYKANIPIRELEALFRDEKIRNQIEVSNKEGNLPIHVYLENDGIDMRVINFLLPEVKIEHQNNNGDTILHIIVRKPNNEDFLETIWMLLTEEQLSQIKEKKNKAGHTVQKMCNELAKSKKTDEEYTGMNNFLEEVYDTEQSEHLRELYYNRKIRENLFGATKSDKKPKEKLVPTFDAGDESVLKSLSFKISKRDEKVLVADFEQDKGKLEDQLVYGIVDIQNEIDEGTTFKHVYLDKDYPLAEFIDSDSILEVRRIPFTNEFLKKMKSTGMFIIGVKENY